MWLPSSSSQDGCPFSKNSVCVSGKKKGRAEGERLVSAESVPIHEESDCSPRSHPSRLLIGRNWSRDDHWLQGSLGREHLIWDSGQGQGSGSKNDGEGGRRGAVSASVLLFMFYWWGSNTGEASRPTRGHASGSVQEPEPPDARAGQGGVREQGRTWTLSLLHHDVDTAEIQMPVMIWVFVALGDLFHYVLVTNNEVALSFCWYKN